MSRVAIARGADRPDQRGFALLVLLGVIAAASMAIVLAAQRFVPPWSIRATTTADNLVIVQGAATRARRTAGTFPANLNTLATSAALPPAGSWRRDPFGVAQDLDYRATTAALTVRSRGLDRRLNTADDVVATVPSERIVRLRQRARLRLLRALLLRSPYRLQPSMSAADQAAMRTATHDYARALRGWLTADAAGRAAATTRMTAASAAINALVAAHSCPPLPPALTGAAGLMTRIGAVDGMAVDGRGRALVTDPVLGMRSRGNDGRRSTDDDM